MMKLPQILWTIWLLAASLLSVASAASTAEKGQRDKGTRPNIGAREDDDRPNIIFILAEDMGLGDLACYGHPYARTPNLDRLAAEGTRFTRFYVAGATCNPSRTGFMSGRNPPTLPNYQADFGFPENTQTITKLLHDSGYATGHIGKWHIGPIDDQTHQTLGIDEIKVMGGAVNSPLGKDARVYEAGMDFIERHKDEPFYLNLWSHVAHSPVEPRESLINEFNDVTVKRSDFDRYMQKKFDNAEKLGGQNAIKKGMRKYLADIWGMDRMVGRLMDKLDELGISHNTILAFTADHGAAPIMQSKQSTPTSMMGWAGGLKGAKHTFYEGGIRVPFILRWPGRIPSGKVNDKSIVSALDWLPTVCSLAKVSIQENMFDGEDVSDVWLGEKQRSRRDPLFWKFNRDPSDEVMLYGSWKMFKTRQGDFRLYDLTRDSAESDDRTNEEPEIANGMKQKLLQWEGSLPQQYCIMKQGCETPIPFDGSTRPIYVGPPEILLVDDAGAEVQKPPNEYVDEVSKKDATPSGFAKPSGTKRPTSKPTKAPTSTEAPIEAPTKKQLQQQQQKKEDSVSSDGMDLDEMEKTLTPTKRPTRPIASPTVISSQQKATSTSPTASPIVITSPQKAMSASPTASPVVSSEHEAGDETKSSSSTRSPTSSKSETLSKKENDDIDDMGVGKDEEWQLLDPTVSSSSEITQRNRGLSLSLATGSAIASFIFVMY